MTMENIITYEQPLNEIIRVCLRLEQLFLQIDHQLTDTSQYGTRNIVGLIINALHLLDRPDLKAKLAKELNHHHSNLMRYRNIQAVDSDKFRVLTTQLEELSRSLIDNSSKIGYRLRDTELFNALRMHLATPGGGCSFDIPVFYYWLQRPAEDRLETIVNWLSDFTEIRTAIMLVLEIVRGNTKIEEKTAVHGFHQELLDPQSNLRMIRISIDYKLATYPEISVGRHFLSVRFYIPDIQKRPVQYTENLTFQLGYCNP